MSEFAGVYDQVLTRRHVGEAIWGYLLLLEGAPARHHHCVCCGTPDKVSHWIACGGLDQEMRARSS